MHSPDFNDLHFQLVSQKVIRFVILNVIWSQEFVADKFGMRYPTKTHTVFPSHHSYNHTPIDLKPNSITLACSELAPNQFRASSELTPNRLGASSEPAPNWFGAEPARNQLV